MPNSRHLTVLVVLCAVLAIAASLLGERATLAYQLLKPATTILVLAQLWQPPNPAEPRYLAALRIGVLLSLIGDILLLPPWDVFIGGLLAFLAAHIAFIVAFAPGSHRGARVVAILFYAAVATANLSLLLPRVAADLRQPVLAYVAVLVLMASFTAARAWTLRAHPRLRSASRFAAFGGLLFVVSDSLLAWDRFGGGIPLASLWILASYWAALWCIARSARWN